MISTNYRILSLILHYFIVFLFCVVLCKRFVTGMCFRRQTSLVASNSIATKNTLPPPEYVMKWRHCNGTVEATTPKHRLFVQVTKRIALFHCPSFSSSPSSSIQNSSILRSPPPLISTNNSSNNSDSSGNSNSSSATAPQIPITELQSGSKIRYRMCVIRSNECICSPFTCILVRDSCFHGCIRHQQHNSERPLHRTLYLCYRRFFWKIMMG